MAKRDQEAQAQPVADGADSFKALLHGAIKPRTASAKAEIDRAVVTLAEQAIKDSVVISDDVVGTIKAMIAGIDAMLSEQINVILHNDKFQRLEGAWRGLHHLVNNTETDTMLKIRVMDISKQDLGKSLKKYRGANWDRSPLYEKVYGEEYDVPGGQPYGCLVGDYSFDHTPADVEILGLIAQVAAAAHAPFIAAAAPSLLGLDSWQELARPKDIAKIFTRPDYAGWRSLRKSEDAKYIGLAMPRFLARLPYGAKTAPVEEFEFEEETAGGQHDNYTWANAAYAMAVNINRSFKSYGWCSRIRGLTSGGAVESLPVHTFPSDDGGVDMKCPTEIAIGDRRDNELSGSGLMALSHYKNSDLAAFMGAQSLQEPEEFSDPDATDSAKLSARLPYLFATCRFAHYLKCMVRDKMGSYMERAEMERYLSDWIKDYVLGNPADAGEVLKAEKPLAAAEVTVSEVEGNPGFYSAKFALRPHYQLEGMNATLSLVSRLPSERAA